jgi:mono/diheme cytochrome c family protein
MSNYQQRLVRLCALLLSLSAASPSCIAEQAEAGERLFLDNCAECHQPNGQGIRGVYPSLAASEIVRGSGADVALQLQKWPHSSTSCATHGAIVASRLAKKRLQD